MVFFLLSQTVSQNQSIKKKAIVNIILVKFIALQKYILMIVEHQEHTKITLDSH